MDKLLDNLMISYFAQIDSALKISRIISEHSNEDHITPDSLISGLVYRLMIPMEDNELNTSLENAKEIMEGSSSDEDYEKDFIDDEIFSEDDRDLVILSRKLKKNNCTCDICSEARECLDKFSNYECTDELSQKYKDSINDVLIIHRITI